MDLVVAAAAGEAMLFRAPKTDWIYTETQLSNPPSLKLAKASRKTQGQAPVSLDIERTWRKEAVGHIQNICAILKNPVSVTAHAATLLHRFFMEQSFLEFRKFYVATCCVLVAMKMSPEAQVSQAARAKDVLKVSLQRADMEAKDDTAHFRNHQEELLYCERALLATMGFNLEADTPQVLIPTYINTMGLNKANKVDNGHELITSAIRIANAILGSQLCLLHPAPTIACAAIEWAATEMKISLPQSSGGSAWYEAVTLTQPDKSNMKDHIGAILDRMKEYIEEEQSYLDTPPTKPASLRTSSPKRRSSDAASATKKTPPAARGKRSSLGSSGARRKSSRTHR
eukprot:m.83323 g.83323  ORF g.83323 m.83323 type:complete len:342 (+) comp19625_c0_seq2:285-1310(+)